MFSTPGKASVSSGSVGPHIMGAVEVSTTGTPRTRAARANATTLWRTSSGARSRMPDEPGLVVDKQEYSALRHEALVGAAPAALGLVFRLRIAHSVLLLTPALHARRRRGGARMDAAHDRSSPGPSDRRALRGARKQPRPRARHAPRLAR